jgi:hypothetical protein
MGPVLVGRSGGASHVPLPCFTHTCTRCGPERSDIIQHDMCGRLASCGSLWLCSFAAPTLRQLSRLIRTATRAINTRGGNYLRLTMARGSVYVGVLLADVDHSANPRGRPPRKCDPLEPGEAIAYLDYLLWHGIVSRRSSEKWPLTDGERAHAGTSDRTRVGALGMRTMPLLTEHARRIYGRDRRAAARRGEELPDWPDDASAPPTSTAPTQSVSGPAHTPIPRPSFETVARGELVYDGAQVSCRYQYREYRQLTVCRRSDTDN